MHSLASETSHALPGLRLRWLGAAAGSAALLGAGYLALRSAWEPASALRWLLLAAAGQGYLAWVFYTHLGENRRAPQEPLLPDLGLPNQVTFWRGLLVAAAAGFLLSPHPGPALAWVPGILYSLGILPDYLDGYLARLTRRSTRLGETLDVHVDYLAFLSGVLLVIQYGQAPGWFILVALARYLFVFGVWLRQRLGKPVYDLPPSLARRAFSGMQMGVIMVLLWPLFSPPATTIAAALFALPFLANFTRDWLYVSGALQPPAPHAAPASARLTRWLPLILRLLAAALLSRDLIPRLGAFAEQAAGFDRLGAAAPALLVALLLGLQAAAAGLLALGIMGRSMAVLALGLSGLSLRFGASLTPPVILLLVSAAGVFFLGSGAFSLWAPEEILLRRRAGEPQA